MRLSPDPVGLARSSHLYVSRVEAFATRTKLEASDQALFGGRSRDQCGFRATKSYDFWFYQWFCANFLTADFCCDLWWFLRFYQMAYKISRMSEFAFTSMVDTKCSTFWLANLFHPFHSIVKTLRSSWRRIPFAASGYKLLLCTYLKFWQWLLITHKYSCSLQGCSLCRMARAIYMNQTCYVEMACKTRTEQAILLEFHWRPFTHEINRLWTLSAMQHILSHHRRLFLLPSAAQSSSDVIDVSAVDSTPLGDCGYIETWHLWSMLSILVFGCGYCPSTI